MVGNRVTAKTIIILVILAVSVSAVWVTGTHWSPTAQAEADGMRSEDRRKWEEWEDWRRNGLPLVQREKANQMAQTVVVVYAMGRVVIVAASLSVIAVMAVGVLMLVQRARIPAWRKLPDNAVIMPWSVYDPRTGALVSLERTAEPNLALLDGMSRYKSANVSAAVRLLAAMLSRGAATRADRAALTWAVNTVQEENDGFRS